MKDLGETWKTDTIPKEQYKIVSKELEQLRNGKPIYVWQCVADAIKKCVPENGLHLMEIGCASGYFYEVFKTLLGDKIKYTGADYSKAMVDMAKKNYPECKYKQLDIRSIDLLDRSQDIVFSSAVLEHVSEWKKGIVELTRIADKYLILHKTPVTQSSFYTESKEIYGGVLVFFNKFNRNEIVNMVLNQGFNLIYEEKTHPHPNNVYKIFVFRRNQ